MVGMSLELFGEYQVDRFLAYLIAFPFKVSFPC